MLLCMLYQRGSDELHFMHTPAEVATQFQIHSSSNQRVLSLSLYDSYSFVPLRLVICEAKCVSFNSSQLV